MVRTSHGWFVLALVLAPAPAQRGIHTEWREVPRRAVLSTPGGELPFVLAIGTSGDDSKPSLAIYNGAAHVAASSDPRASPLTLLFPPYDSRLEFAAGDHDDDDDPWAGVLRGTWTKVGPQGPAPMSVRCEPWPAVGAGDQRGPLFAVAGEPWQPAGRWRLQFATDPQPSVLLLEPSRGPWSAAPGEVQGTVLTATGDYRHLAGTARGKELRLSTFDGAHAFLLACRVLPDGSMTGDFWSGANWHESLVARPDPAAALPDAFTLTKARPDVAIGDLRYPDAATGEPRRLGDLFGTVTIVLLLGTWCPNCNDAGDLLRSLAQHHDAERLRIVGLAFEHGDDSARHRRVVSEYRAKRRIAWPILLAGSSAKDKASKQFPVVDAVRAFPTMLFVDAAGTVRAVHQGFVGPADREGHRAQWQVLHGLVARLLAEAPPPEPARR